MKLKLQKDKKNNFRDSTDQRTGATIVLLLVNKSNNFTDMTLFKSDNNSIYQSAFCLKEKKQ